MILPSDDDSRKDDDADRPEGDEEDFPWKDEPEPPGFFGEEETDPETGETVHNPAGPGWREDLKEDLADAVAELKEIEDPDEDFDPPEPPDLFAFYSELVVMRNELRNIGGCLTQMMPGGIPGPPGGPQEVVAALVHAWDELEEKGKAQLPVLAPVMKAAGVTRIKVKAGAAFDPASMTTDDIPSAHSKVGREVFSGWIWNGIVIRPAHVTLK